MAASLPAYSGSNARCQKCDGSSAATAWHNGGAAEEQTSRGRDWPCRSRAAGWEHLCRECRTCGYAWAETLPPDDEPRAGSPEVTQGTGQAREDFEREAIAAFENLAAAIGGHNLGPTPEECRHAARLLIKQTADRVRAGEYVILSHAHFSALVGLASKHVPDGEGLWGSSARR